MLERVGPFEVVRELGRGGMGVVYLARDTRLGRQVAIKALPAELAFDPARLERFEREARTLAQLNHPNLAGIHGVEEQDGARYLVLEYVEGESLADRLDRGPLPVDEAVGYAVQIAAGLEAAHEAGAIHRDLKPANVMLTPDGQAKVLDFGLARTEEGGQSSSGGLDSPTLTHQSPHSPTIAGAILGTAAYMSPEQARGRPVDKRTDIWSFGVVLYEMLVGASPFHGETATDSIGAVLHKDLDLDRLPPDTPPWVRRTLAWCLVRDKNARFRDIGDVRLHLATTEEPAGSTSCEQRQPRGLVAVVACASLLVCAGAVIWAWSAVDEAGDSMGASARPEPRRFSVLLPESAPLAPPSAYPFGVAGRMFDLSPDGTMLAYTGIVDDQVQIQLHSLVTGRTRPFEGGRGGTRPTFSADGESLAFFKDESVVVLDLEHDGEPEVLGRAPFAWGIAWGPDGTVYFCGDDNAPIMANRPGRGASSRPVTLGSASRLEVYPSITPDGERLLFSVRNLGSQVWAMELEDPASQRMLIENAGDARMVSPEILLFERDGRLMATRVGPGLALVGEPSVIRSDIRHNRGEMQYELSADGTLIFLQGGSDNEGKLGWVDRTGAFEELGIPPGEFGAFKLSPDARRLAVPIRSGMHRDMWVFDLDRPRVPSRLTIEDRVNSPVWSPDGRYLLHSSFDETSISITLHALADGGPPRTVRGIPERSWPVQYLADSGQLLFCAISQENGYDLMLARIDLDQPGEALATDVRPLAATQWNEAFGVVSPDRRWMVANSDETGRWEVFLSSFPSGGDRIQISTAGGEEPRWTEDGSKVLYRWNDEWFEVEINAAGPGTSPAAPSPPRMIAKGPYINIGGYSWDMMPDGSRLLLIQGASQDTPIRQLEVITGFLDQIRDATGLESRDGSD